jgi:hypothetical protein
MGGLPELYDMWRLAGTEPDRLLWRVTFFAHPDADFRSDEGREKYRRFWHDAFARKDALRIADVAGQLGVDSHAEFIRTRDVAQKIAEMLRLIEDVLKARTIEELISQALGVEI